MSVRAIDAADYILEQYGKMSAMKLQKLVYYSQAWHLVWKDTPLFDEEVQAWANGPVVPELFTLHQGFFQLEPGFFRGNAARILEDSKDVITRVLAFYGPKDAQWLSELSHMEDPWKLAREGITDGERCGNVISHEKMAEYYSSI